MDEDKYLLLLSLLSVPAYVYIETLLLRLQITTILIAGLSIPEKK